jgi:hypothetical protein
MTQAAISNWWYSDTLPQRRPRRSQSNEIVQLAPRERATLNEPQFEWLKPVVQRLTEICALPVGWDGYRGRPTRFDIASFTFSMLQNICAPDSPAPSLVPLSSGGLQVEWHTDQIEIELTVHAPYSVQAWITDPTLGDDGVERPLTTDYSSILPWVQRLG